jgi:hypothetical protein
VECHTRSVWWGAVCAVRGPATWYPCMLSSIWEWCGCAVAALQDELCHVTGVKLPATRRQAKQSMCSRACAITTQLQPRHRLQCRYFTTGQSRLSRHSCSCHSCSCHMIPQTGSRNQREQSGQAHHTSCNEKWGSKHKRIVFAFDPAV